MKYRITIDIIGRGYSAVFGSIDACWDWYKAEFRQDTATLIKIEREES